MIALVAVVALGSTTGLTQALQPPGPVQQREPHLFAVALERGVLHRTPDVGSEAVFEFRRGQVFDYLGESVDTFGRDWHSVGNQEAWVRVEKWYSIPATRDEARALSGTVSVLDVLPPPLSILATLATSVAATTQIAAAKHPIPVAVDWWDQAVRVDAGALGEFGRVVGVPARIVPRVVADELVALLGGPETFGPWPEEPAYGRLFVAPRTGLVYRHDGNAWGLTDPPLTMDSTIGLLGNPELMFDLDRPAEAHGLHVSCWPLVGGLNPRGAAAGMVSAASAPPARLTAAERPDTERFLGYYDLTPRAWPSAVPTMQAPRRVLPAYPAKGVTLADNSRRQAVYLEQVVPVAITRQLRGREVQVRLMARASLAAGSASATVAVEIQAGALRQSLSAQVGALATPVTLPFTVPEDADTITVRLLPNDVSIVVTESGTAVIDSATLVLADWPEVLEPAPLLLRRIRTVTYRPAARYTRARVVISDRPRSDLVRIIRSAGDTDDATLEKILSGDIEIDMNERHVQLAWGDPESVADGELTVWGWPDRTASFDGEGRLLAWSRRPEASLVWASLCGPQLELPPNEAR